MPAYAFAYAVMCISNNDGLQALLYTFSLMYSVEEYHMVVDLGLYQALFKVCLVLSLTHSICHSLTHSHTHSLTHSITQLLTAARVMLLSVANAGRCCVQLLARTAAISRAAVAQLPKRSASDASQVDGASRAGLGGGGASRRCSLRRWGHVRFGG